MKRGQPIAEIVAVLFIVGWILYRTSVPRTSERSLGQLVVEFMPVILAGGLALFLRRSNHRQRVGILLSFVVPGFGHLWLGHRSRGLLFAALLVPLFLAGMVMAGFANISPFDRHPIWGLAQIPGGVMVLVSWLLTSTVKIAPDNPYYLAGCLYSGTACLLNLLVMCDLWDIEGNAPSAAPAPLGGSGRRERAP